MNKIQQLFERKNKNILSVYFTAGYPELESTNEILTALADNGVDMIEIGMPYSDPLADGPVIQHSSSVAIANGMTIAKLFEQLGKLKLSREVPLLLMGYLNPVIQYGFENFCRDASAVGISGLIIPDLPLREYRLEYEVITKKYGLSFVFLITPETSEERIREIDNLSDGFIYAVSSSSVTGRATDESRKEDYFKRIGAMNLKNPVVVGFGVKDKATFEHACKYLNGAISGTAFINQLTGNEKSIEENTKTFLNMFR
ncbi:MAG: tryptophan synthase subunit alpha [Chitinophagaceae bacterium]|nr:tryptophan synthase subunit alpha [Chitinophagaceae bacterium]